MPRRRNFKDPRKPMLILTAGENEALYFSQMRRDCRYANIEVRQKSKESATLSDMIKEAGRIRLDEGFDSSWCIFNPLDVEINPTELALCRPLAEKRRVALAYSNPGIEFWYYLHFAVPETPFRDREDVAQALQKYIPGFSLDPDYLREEGADLYMKLFTNKAQAVLYANRFNMLFGERVSSSGPRLDYACTIPKLLTDINNQCGKCFIAKGQNALELQKYN